MRAGGAMRTKSFGVQRVVAVLWSVVLAIGLGGVATAQGVGPGPAPMVVPVPTGDEAVITVRVGSDRVGTTGVTGLAGSTLQLYDGTATGPTTPVAADWATCVSDADGDCSFVVPDTEPGGFGCFGGGANCDRRFWVVQTGVPEGYVENETLRTGNGDGTASQLTPYQFRTGTTLRAGGTYSSQTNFMVSTGGTNRSASGGVWQQSRVNPAPLTQCGLSVAVVLDLSGSVDASELAALKGAADTFVDTLVGTPSQVALFSFSTITPALGATQNYPGLTSVATQEGANEVKARYASWTAQGGTNWDRGLAAVAEANPVYDIAIVITDGDPTYYSQPAEGPGNFNRIREMENGIFSANAVKAESTRVLAVGVGSGVSDPATARNLSAISGATAYDGTNATTADYFQVSDYTIVGQALRQLALGECEGSLSVVKQVVGADGDISTAEPGGADWTFDAATTSPGVTLGATTGTTDASSAVNFPITYSGVTGGTVTVTEQPREGSTLFPVAGANAVCTDIDAGTDIPVTNSGATGFSVEVSSTVAVSCTVYNQVAEPASVTVDKEWVINGADPVPQGSQPPGFTSQLTLTGPSGAPATEQGWGVTRTGYVAGEQVTIDEQVTLDPGAVDADLCTVSTPAIVEIDGVAVTPDPVPAGGITETLDAGANTYTVRNTVTCESRLTLAKDVEGEADAALWTLSALPAPGTPAGQLPGPSGTAGSAAVTDQTVTTGIPYQLAESGGPATYLQDDQRTDLQTYPLSTGSWTCLRVDAEGNEIAGFTDGLNGGVTVPIGARVACTATNRTAQLTLAKEVVNDTGGTATPADFTLRAVPSADPPVTGLEDVEVTGALPADASPVEIRPGTTYALSETGPVGYTATAIQCTVDGTTAVVTEITLTTGQAALCVFVNDDDPAQLTLRKVVDNGTTGATGTPADWTLTATPQDIPDQEAVSGNGADGVTSVPVIAGSYALTESEVSGYEAGDWTCTDALGGTVAVTDGVVTLSTGAEVTCSITNTAQPSTLTLVKDVTNDDGGTAVATDWTLTATGPTTGVSGVTGDPAVTGATVAIGDYTLSESGPAGYTAGDWACATGTADLPVTGGVVTIPLGQAVTCTITNDDEPGTLTLTKTVVNDNGGTAEATDWTLTADGPTTGISGATGSEAVTGVEVSAGTYTLSETGPDGYTASDWTCTDGEGTGVPVTDGAVTIALGQTVTCTIANDDEPGTLTLTKTVVNDDGGTAVATDWTLTATGPTTGISGATGSEAVTGVAVSAGAYALSETGPAGYTASDWTCTGGTLSGGTVTVANGATVTCTITNDDEPATLTLTKTVVNDNGGTAEATDWTLTADGPTTGISGATGSEAVTGVEVLAGTYTLSETGPAGYTASDWTCVDGEGTSVPVTDGTVTIAVGQSVTCTITNDDDAWTAVKTSDPASGVVVQPGQVITYRVEAAVVSGSSIADVEITDDLSQVLPYATFVEGSITASTGSAELSGTTLTWTVGTLEGVQTLTYQVRVNDDVDGQVLRNVVTAPGAQPCEPVVPDDAVPGARDALGGQRVLLGQDALRAQDLGGVLSAQAANPLAAAADDPEYCRTTEHPTPSVTPTPTPQPTVTPTVRPYTPGDGYRSSQLAASGAGAEQALLGALGLLAAGAVGTALARRRGRGAGGPGAGTGTEDDA